MIARSALLVPALLATAGTTGTVYRAPATVPLGVPDTWSVTAPVHPAPT